MTLHYETISNEMLNVLKKLMCIEELSPFRLVGGTALALQFGHRKSIDIDLFADGRTNTNNLPILLSSHFNNAFKLISKNRDGIVCQINDIKLDIINWKVPFALEPIQTDEIRMATAQDIFANKCEALLNRKAEKDFVDIAVISSAFDLSGLFSILKTRYSFITTGAITAFLLRRDLIERDTSIEYLGNQNFDSYADLLQSNVIEYEKNLKIQKQTEIENREKRIQDLIKQKKK